MATPVMDVLEEAAKSVSGLIAINVVGTDGIPIAEVNPTRSPTEAFAAKFALVMSLVRKSVSEIGAGTVEENLVEHDKGWFLTRFIGKGEYYLGLAVTKESVLGMVRMTAKQTAAKLASLV